MAGADQSPADPNEVALVWRGEHRFDGRVGATPVRLDGTPEAADALTPMQSVAAGLAGCMAIDIVDILQKGRQPMSRLELELHSERAADPPRRFVRFEMTVVVAGEVDPARVERAIALSRDKYCSVWHSLQQDTEFEVDFRIEAA